MKFVLPALAILFLTPVHADFADDANTAIRTLQDKWYDTNTGLWYVPLSILALRWALTHIYHELLRPL